MTATTRWIGIVLFVLVGVGQPVRLGLSAEPTAPDPNDPKLVARGKFVYDEQCATATGRSWKVSLIGGTAFQMAECPRRRTTRPGTHGTTRTSNCST